MAPACMGRANPAGLARYIRGLPIIGCYLAFSPPPVSLSSGLSGSSAGVLRRSAAPAARALMTPMPAAGRRSRSPAPRWAPRPGVPDPRDSGAATPVGLARVSVHGGIHATVGPILRGSYKVTTQHHGRPVYQKDERALGLFVMLYYWDTRDGAAFSGWWFGPRVGSDQVWAFHPADTPTPPTVGWRAPCDGPVDTSLVLSRQATTARRRMQRRHSSLAQQASAGALQWPQPPMGCPPHPTRSQCAPGRGAPPPRLGSASTPTFVPGIWPGPFRPVPG